MNNVLIYSLNCPKCKELLETLKNIPHVAKTMEGYQVEELIQQDKLPKGVTHVPTVLTATGERLYGNKVFRWVEHMTNTLGTPTREELQNVEPMKHTKSLSSMNVSYGKNSSLGGSEISSIEETDIVTEHFASLGAKNGSDIDPDNYVAGKKMYGEVSMKAESTRSKSNLPNINELIQKRKQTMNSAYN